MKHLLLLMVTLVAGSVFGMNHSAATPPDSTTSIVDKSAAIYIVEEGKTLYNEAKYREALIKFRQASVKDPNSWKAAYWIGKCHYMMHNYGYALKYANEALSLGDDKVTEEIHYLLGSTYHRLGDLDSAIVNYELALHSLSDVRSNTLNIQHNIDECHFAKEELKKEPVAVKVKLPGDINSGYDDYKVVPTSDPNVLYFTSRRPNTTGGGINPDDEQYFEDTYVAVYDPEMKSWDSTSNELGKLNGDGFESLDYLSPDGMYGIITLNTTALDIKKTTKSSDLAEVKRNDKGTWNSPKVIKNKKLNTTYFEGAATLTADGNTMYFISERNADKTGWDIYVTHREGNTWSDPKPLPSNVNSDMNENGPYITPDGRYLFFSSNGHTGMGGFDIYVSENLGDSWSDPVNLGNGINTVNDDKQFIYLPELKKAYITAIEVIGNKASSDIFEVDLTNFKIPTKPE